MTTEDEAEAVQVPLAAGECATCAHARALRNRRGSIFVLCGRARDDASFKRYPPLPVSGCAGYERASA